MSIKTSVEEKRRIVRKLTVACSVVCLMCIICGIVIYAVGRDETASAPKVSEEDVIEYNGSKYVPKKNIETYLFMGIDNDGVVKECTDYKGQGRSDTLILLVRDISEGTYKTLHINRNTLAEVDSMLLDGTVIDTAVMQLALAHETGNGLELSCENTVNAVSKYLGGQKIDGYAAVNMGAIPTINNLVGGVTVTIEDDFKDLDPSLELGKQIKLSDEQAYKFVRGRMSVGDGSNQNRMNRQAVYIEALKPIVEEKCASDADFPLQAYDAMEDYMVTNISKQKFSKMALLVAKGKDEGRVEITGASGKDEAGYTTFTADSDSLMEAILELFYKRYE